MRKLVLLIAVIAIAFVSCKEDATKKIKADNLKKAAKKTIANNADAPVIEFNKAIHDWGTINEGDQVETTFTFKNTGKSPLLITNIKGSCGCTVPTGWPKEPIMPGASGKFDVKFNSKGKPGNKQNTVTITCNTNKGKEFVKVKASVTPDPAQEKIRTERAAKRKIDQVKRAADKAKKDAEAGKNILQVK